VTQRPNILLITSDQQHWNTRGVTNPEVKTPNLDRLDANGTLFTRACCPNPTCTPIRASIIIGTYPSQHGAWSLGTKLPESRPTVGDAFQEAGYGCQGSLSPETVWVSGQSPSTCENARWSRTYCKGMKINGRDCAT
jgi:arylsulfatase A-like enzyme